MTRRLIRFPMAEPLETALVAATELDREQLEQLRDQVAALLEALPPPLPPPAPAPAPVGKPNAERSPYLAGLPEGPRGGGAIEWKWHRQGDHRYGPYPYLRLRLGGRQRSIYLRALAQATRESATRGRPVSPSA